MAIASLSEYKTKLSNTRNPYFANFGFSAGLSYTRLYDGWLAAQPASSIPSTAVVPAQTESSALNQLDPSTGQLSILGFNLSGEAQSMMIICDRLSHQGGLDGTSTSTQTTNLPSAALTRYTSGEGVFIGISIYTTIGNTATTVSVSYTNQSGTSGRTGTRNIGGNDFNAAGIFILIPLQEGDTGARSVESVTLSASTGTIGNFGIVLFRPLYLITNDGPNISINGDFITGNSSGGIPKIENGACLVPIISCKPQVQNTRLVARFVLSEN